VTSMASRISATTTAMAMPSHHAPTPGGVLSLAAEPMTGAPSFMREPAGGVGAPRIPRCFAPPAWNRPDNLSSISCPERGSVPSEAPLLLIIGIDLTCYFDIINARNSWQCELSSGIAADSLRLQQDCTALRHPGPGEIMRSAKSVSEPAAAIAKRKSPPDRPHARARTTGAAVPQERALPVSLLRAREAVMLHMRPILRSHGFTEQQWRVLRSLDQHKPMDKTTLAARSTLLMPSLLRILKDLEQMGLVRSVPSISNQRLVRIVLSAKGSAAVEKGSRDLADMTRIMRERIGGDTVDELLRLLHVVEVRLLELQ
jgi:homoprotocatechuate degradation regulator HpaR